MIVFPLFADVELDEVVIGWQRLAPEVQDTLLVVGALVLAGLAAFIWAAFLRTYRKRKHRHSHHANPSAAHVETREEEHTSRGRKWRRRRREHRPRNPTLAETGGLPPIRSDESPDRMR